MVPEPRITMHTLAVLKVLLESPTADSYGLDLAKRAGIKTSSVYPVLMRLEQARWVTSSWEPIEPTEARRPRRRLYRLTAEGVLAAVRELAKAQQAFGVHSQGPGFVPGVKPGVAT
jgi:DNA-binding PadR family transcriptional regulator